MLREYAKAVNKVVLLESRNYNLAVVIPMAESYKKIFDFVDMDAGLNIERLSGVF
jgi:hypothetical protein